MRYIPATDKLTRPSLLSLETSYHRRVHIRNELEQQTSDVKTSLIISRSSSSRHVELRHWYSELLESDVEIARPIYLYLRKFSESSESGTLLAEPRSRTVAASIASRLLFSVCECQGNVTGRKRKKKANRKTREILRKKRD